MKSEKNKSEISLSNTSLRELLEATLAKKVPFRFAARGFSMSPFIKDGDIITVSPLVDFPIGLGKPVAFIQRERRELVIHRVIGKKGCSYLLKADNLWDADGLISRDNILGTVTMVERENKKVFFGFGSERFVVAFLSRTRLLSFVLFVARMLPFPVRRFLYGKIVCGTA